MKSITNEAHKLHTMFQGAGTYMPRVGTKTVQVKQDLENGCGFWRGDNLDSGQCPECGSDTNTLSDDHFDD